MLTTRLLICLGIVALTTPALCAQYFIVQQPGTNRCTITGQPPAAGDGTLVGDGVYGDQASAEIDMRAIAACAGNRQQQMALTAPASFFIVQEPGTNRCTIIGQQPAEGTSTIVGDGAYADRATAEADIRAIAACAESGR